MSFTRSIKFLRQSIIVKYTYGTLVWISTLDRAPGHFGQGIIVIKLILVDFDGHNANITLNFFSPLSWKTFEIWGGGTASTPPMPILNTSRRCL